MYSRSYDLLYIIQSAQTLKLIEFVLATLIFNPLIIHTYILLVLQRIRHLSLFSRNNDMYIKFIRKRLRTRINVLFEIT